MVVYYVMALVLFAQASYGEVLRCLLEGVRWLRLKGDATALAGKSAITRARIRLGVEPMRQLYERVARPLAEPDLPGAFYRGRRLVSLDGTTIPMPDEPDLDERFGRPVSAAGAGPGPRARLPARMESGIHAIFAAALGRYDASEAALAPALLARLQAGMLCLADRGFVGFELGQAARATGADLLWRVKSNQKFPCYQRLSDGSYLSRLRPSSGPRRFDRAVVSGPRRFDRAVVVRSLSTAWRAFPTPSRCTA